MEEETIWNFDADDLEAVPEAVGNALRELEREGVHVVEGPRIERVVTPAGVRWSVTFVVQEPLES
jgi:hypothetical protein